MCVVTKHAGAGVLAGRIAWDGSSRRPATKCVVTGSQPWGTCEQISTRREATAGGLSGTALRLDVLQLLEEPAAQPAAAGCGLTQCQTGGGFSRQTRAISKPTDVFQTCSRLPLRFAGCSKRPITALGVSSCCVLCHASPVSAQLAAEAVFFATAKRRCSVHPNLIPARYLLDTCLIPGSHPEEAGFKSGPHRLSPIKFLIAKNPLPCRRSTRPNAPVGTVPAVRYRRACNLLLRFPGEQLALGASKITVYCLHLYSLTTSGQLSGFFQTVRKLYSE